MAVDGVIAERARAVLPATWDALAKDTTRFGEPQLRSTVDYVKDRIFGVVVAPAAEASYPFIVIDYVAKLVALELCNPGIDFWMNEFLSESATGTNENVTFTDRAAVLERLRASLLEETRMMKPEVDPLIGYVRIVKSNRPLSNTIDEDFITPSPLEFPRPYRVSDRT